MAALFDALRRKGWRLWLAAAAAACLTSAGPAAADDEDWVEVVRDPDGGVWAVQPSSVQRVGDHVFAWVSHEPKKKLLSPNTRRRYDYSVHGRLEDCLGRRSAESSVVYRRDDGPDVEERVYEDAQLNFQPRAPGTIVDAISAYVCTLDAKLAGLKPHFPIESAGPQDWSPIGRDPAGELAIEVLTKSAVREKAVAAIIARTTYARLAQLPDGRGFKSVVVRVVFDCDNAEHLVLAEDFYSAEGRLVDAKVTPEEAPGEPVAPGTLSAMVRDVACAAPPRQAQAGTPATEPAIYSGTGWLAERGYIVTASHVIEGAHRIWIYQEGRRLGAAEVVRDDPANDVAVLKPLFDTSPYAALRVNGAPAVLGQRVFTLGYPLFDELGMSAVKMTAGDVSSLAGVDVVTGRANDHRFLQVSIPIQSGNSGGPVIAPDGSVVGLVVSKKSATADREIVQNVNFALKAGYISSMISELPPVGRAQVASVRGDTAAVVAGVQSGVFLVVVEGDPE